MSLKRELGLLSVFSLAAGAMVSSGIFVLPGVAHAQAGPSVILSYFIAGLLATIGMLNAAELATAMPKAGGDYFFITRTLGPAFGSVAGLLNWFSLSLKSAFALVGMAAFTQLFIAIDMRIAGVVLCAAFVGINLFGTRHTGRLQVVFVAGLLVLMIFYIVRGLPRTDSAFLTPFFPHGVHRTLATAGFVFVAYGGLIQISGVAEEVKDPTRTLPLGMFLALGSVMVLYTLMVFVTSGVLPSEELDHSLTPITDGAARFMGVWGVRALSLAAVLAFVSTANAGIMSASRYLYALGRDELLPAQFARLSQRTHVPVKAVLATGLFVGASLFLKLQILVEAASLVLILGFILSSVCVIILREGRVQNYRPSFRAPLYPFVQIAGILGFLLLVFELGIEAYAICTGLFVIGIASYWFFGRKRARRDYALLHLIERITSRDLVTGSLESELKEVVRERDAIAVDRFDEVVGRAMVLDIAEPVDAEYCFRALAGCMADRLDLSKEDLVGRLKDRETQSSTVLTPFLAVPHVVVPGKARFEIGLIRARKGVRFSEDSPSVHAIFVLLGSADERNFHLRALAGVAQIVQAAQFEERWMSAKGEQGLRDVLLLGKRLR